MPGSVRVSVLEVVDLPLSLVGRTVQVRVALGKKEYKTKPVRAHGGRTPPWNADFAFPVLNLRDQLFIVIVGSRGETMTKAEIEVASVVQNGFTDDFVALQGGGRIHLKLSFVLSEEERRRIEAMRVANQKKREQDSLKARQNSAESNGNGPRKAAASAVTITELTGDADQEDKENEGRTGVVKQGKHLKVAKPVSGGDEQGPPVVPLLSGGGNVAVQQEAGEKRQVEPANSEVIAGEVINGERIGVPPEGEQSAAVDVPVGEPQGKEDAKTNQSSDLADTTPAQTASSAELDVVETGPATLAESLGVIGADTSKAAAVSEEDVRLEQGTELENLLEEELGEQWMDEWMPKVAAEANTEGEMKMQERAADVQQHELQGVRAVQIHGTNSQVDDCPELDGNVLVEEEELGQVGGGTKDAGVAEESILQEEAAEKLIAMNKSPVADGISQIFDKSLPFREQLKAIQQRWEQDDDETLPDSLGRKDGSEETDHTAKAFEGQLKAIQDRWNEASGFQESENDSDENDADAQKFLGSTSDDKDQQGERLLEQFRAIQERWEKDNPSGFLEIEKDAGNADGVDDTDIDGADVQIVKTSCDKSGNRDRPSEELLEQLRAIKKRWDVEEAYDFQRDENELDAGKDEDKNDLEARKDEDENDLEARRDEGENYEDGRDVQELLSNSGKPEEWGQPSEEKLKALQESSEKNLFTEYVGDGSKTEYSVAATGGRVQLEAETSFCRGLEDTSVVETTFGAEAEPALTTCPHQEDIAPTGGRDQLEAEPTSCREPNNNTFLVEATLLAEAEPTFSTLSHQEGMQSPSLADSLTKPATTAEELLHFCSERKDIRRAPRLGSIIAHFFGGAAIVAGAAAVAWTVRSRKYHVVSEGETLGTFASSPSTLQNSRFCNLNPGVCESSRVYPGQRLRLD